MPSWKRTTLLLGLAFGLGAGLLPAEYAFEDNLKDALRSGDENLSAGRFAEAEVDFENALLLAPKNVRAMEQLFHVYVELGNKLLAENMVQRIRELGGVEASRLSAMESRLDGMAGASAQIASGATAGGVSAGAGWQSSPGSMTSPPPARPPAADLGGSRQVARAVPPPDDVLGVGLDEDLSFLEDSLDDELVELDGSSLEDSLEDDSPDTRQTGPVEVAGLERRGVSDGPLLSESGDSPLSKPPAREAPPAELTAGSAEAADNRGLPKEPLRLDPVNMSPEEKFDASVEMARKKDFENAIPLYVSALQQNTSLLARDDFGLRGISQSYYESRAEQNPGNPRIQFMVGWFAELDSRNDVALNAYRQVVRSTRPDDSLHSFALLKVEQIQALLDQIAKVQSDKEEAARKAAREKELEMIASGRAKGLKPEDYLARGEQAFSRWRKDKSEEALEETLAHFEGALVVDGKNPKIRLAYAQVKIDQAIAGNPVAKNEARQQLQTALTLKPDSATRKTVKSLLEGLGGSAPIKAN